MEVTEFIPTNAKKIVSSLHCQTPVGESFMQILVARLGKKT